MLSNLVQNAITHAAVPVTLTFQARREGEGIQLSVQDDGPGIPEANRERIFQKFAQLRDAGAPKVRSSGLGLAFCRVAVESHGGRIWVESTLGEGSTFHLILPLTPPSSALPSRPAAP